MSKFIVYRDEEDLGIKATINTPFVWFLSNGDLYITGRLIPEDGGVFFEPILNWIENCTPARYIQITIYIDLEFINGVGSKYLLMTIKKMKHICKHLLIRWRYSVDDEEMYSLGRTYMLLAGGDFCFYKAE